MALDPNIILQAGKFNTPDPAQILETRAQLQMRNAAIAKANRDEQTAQARTTRLGQIGQQAAGGDIEGARRAAVAAGDFDVVDHLNKLDDDKRAAVLRKVQTAAPIAFDAAKLPYEQRRAFIAQQAPLLTANGWSTEELAGLDPTDQNLGSFVAGAQTLAQKLEAVEKEKDRQLRANEADANRQFARGNAYISAGIIPPGGGGAAAPAGAGGGVPAAGRTQYGWTPRAKNGGDNSDEAVDNKIAGMASHLGIDPTAPLDGLSDLQIAQALTLSEGGKGTLADRNNNPGNLINPKTGGYQRFPTKQAGLEAAARQVARNRARGQNTIQTMVEGLPVGGGSGGGTLPNGLTPIPGGKLDKPKAQRMTREEVAAEGLDPNMAYYRDTNGVPQAVSGQSKSTSLKAAPSAALTSYQENSASLKQVQQALQLLDPKNNSPAAKAARNAIGPGTGALGETFSQWNDPKGVDFRSQIGRIGGIIIKDTSGAAVSASEDARLSKWVPLPSDTVEAARAKLRNLANAIGNNQTAFEDIYNEDNGYRPMRMRGTLSAPAAAPRQPAAPASGPKVGTVEGGYRFKGGNPASPSSWEKVK